jgi:hypothetical protein
MKPYLAVGVIFGLALAIGGYTLGFYKAKQEMEGFAGNLVSGVSASIRGESISLLLSAAEAMKHPEQQEAQRALRRYARSQALAVKECASDKTCASLASQPLPESALIEQALSFK